ncbi:transcriptional regulator [Salmonella enterica]|nr:helix-turn-helix domain-containing protein [Salmonella enterica]EBW7149656.1 transcriptional regulator [Salmonella enterica subsp. enterica serovar Coeln]ECO4402442.1 transcriptional regulator [Salmonella enterica]EGG8606256.1 transcriptional regulator [Salmonella enterica]
MTKMSQGERLKEERKRLGFSQTDFAQMVGASYKSQLRWEKDESSPGADALGIWARVGLDVLYVVTGQRSQGSFDIPEMSPEKQALVEAFDGMSADDRKTLLRVGESLSQPKPSKFAS